jgi:hypothetical protein
METMLTSVAGQRLAGMRGSGEISSRLISLPRGGRCRWIMDSYVVPASPGVDDIGDEQLTGF